MMAYNNGFPMNYQQPIYPQQMYQQPIYQQPQQQQVVQQPQQQAQPQMQNGGFMLIPSEDMARTYPVAPGTCMTFKIEGKPIVMEKSMGFSQLEAPKIDKYRLVKEEDVVEQIPEQQQKEEINYIQQLSETKEYFNNELEKLRGEIDVLRGQIPKPATTKKKDVGGN